MYHLPQAIYPIRDQCMQLRCGRAPRKWSSTTRSASSVVPRGRVNCLSDRTAPPVRADEYRYPERHLAMRGGNLFEERHDGSIPRRAGLRSATSWRPAEDMRFAEDTRFRALLESLAETQRGRSGCWALMSKYRMHCQFRPHSHTTEVQAYQQPCVPCSRTSRRCQKMCEHLEGARRQEAAGGVAMHCLLLARVAYRRSHHATCGRSDMRR